MNDSPPKAERRWYQFRLRTLVMLVLLISLASWYSIRVQRQSELARRQEIWLRQKENRIKRQLQQERIIGKLKSFGPRGFEYREIIRTLYFSKPSELTDDALVELKGLPGLTRLNLGPHVRFADTDLVGVVTKVTDSGLEHLNELTNLETLNLSGSQVTGPGLEHLQGLPNLRELYLGGTKVTDAGLEHLKRLTDLEMLDLRGCLVTDAGLEHLKGLNRLESLLLSHTQVTGPGLEHLEGLTSLRHLSLWNARITDMGLHHLRSQTSLQDLNVDRTDVTGSWPERLKKLGMLKSLNVGYPKVTDAGLEHLKGLTALQKLSLKGSQVTGWGLEHFERLTSLTHLVLTGTQISDAGLAYVKGLNSLENLSLTRTQVKGPGLGHHDVELQVVRLTPRFVDAMGRPAALYSVGILGALLDIVRAGPSRRRGWNPRDSSLRICLSGIPSNDHRSRPRRELLEEGTAWRQAAASRWNFDAGADRLGVRPALGLGRCHRILDYGSSGIGNRCPISGLPSAVDGMMEPQKNEDGR